jgi:hypothetical protein
LREIRECLSGFRFKELFLEHLFWDTSRGTYAVEAGDGIYEIQAVADKKGLVVLVCQPAPGAPFPGSAERKRIEREVSKLHHEHLIVFVDREQTRQVWQVPKREGGKTTGYSEVPFFKGKGVEHLARRIEAISFTLDESETVSLIEVAARVNQALLAEKVTKKFFKEFSDQRKAFLKFLDWIEDESKRDWYCSVLLNRLMFIYFIAEKGFLPEGKTFLSRRLESNAKANGTDTFYTHFLLPLSFFGFGEPAGNRGRFEEQFKGVLYLNGGLFAVHSLERELGISKEAVESVTFPAGATIPDSEFKKWFGYFDDWRWTLDEDKVENEGHISPHILGYIFEKYINQKQMGAYYTKEDITGYICRNTIIPRLFDMLAETGDKGKQAVEPLPIGPHPNLLNDGRGISDGEGIDRYIYPSVKQEEKLPTETDYEQEQRRSRYEALLGEFDAGGFRGIDDFITGNLDIERLALDFVQNIQDADVLHRFYFRGLQGITILDPTCGSGAFLFAGLGILYPLYNAALSRMRYLVGKSTGVEPDVVNWAGRLNFDDLDSGQGVFADHVGGEPKSIQEMKAEVERINDHPSAEYFIKKSIIVNNLFGVDIMEEAVEICKLRLFLSLIATVERDDSKPNMGVEPLPDIDFNILAGNTLVGYASIADIDRLWHEVELGTSTLAFEKDHTRLRDLCREYGEVLRVWRLQQLGEWPGAPVAKEQVLRAAEQVRPELDEDLWRLYRTAGLAAVEENRKRRQQSQSEFKRTHEPFHWLLEFPLIEATGGFDAVVGNPPFVETSEVRGVYGLVAYKTQSCGNLFAHTFERALSLSSSMGRTCLILPISGVSTPRMAPLVGELRASNRQLHVSHFAVRPGKLFDGVDMNLTIINAGKSIESAWHTTGYRRWATESRKTLFDTLSFTSISQKDLSAPIPKFGSPDEALLFQKLATLPRLRSFLGSVHGTTVYVHSGGRYFRKCLEQKLSNEYKPYLVPTSSKFQIIAFLSSSFYYWWWILNSDTYHVTKGDVEGAPIAESVLLDTTLGELGRSLLADLWAHAERRERSRNDGTVQTEVNFHVGASRPLLELVDKRLANLLGLTPEEEILIRAFDSKFRFSASGEE